MTYQACVSSHLAAIAALCFPWWKGGTPKDPAPDTAPGGRRKRTPAGAVTLRVCALAEALRDADARQGRDREVGRGEGHGRRGGRGRRHVDGDVVRTRASDAGIETAVA